MIASTIRGLRVTLVVARVARGTLVAQDRIQVILDALLAGGVRADVQIFLKRNMSLDLGDGEGGGIELLQLQRQDVGDRVDGECF